MDHCRIGSLEIDTPVILESSSDHCRIGSLEISNSAHILIEQDHCRIGSLESHHFTTETGGTRSLPHRQLRNKS